MPKDLQYGPQPYVSVSNPEWEERQSVPMDPMRPPAKDAPTPKAYPIDLHHLSQQAFAHDEAAKKRWFLTAFVAPEDQHLLAPPANPNPAMQALKAIKKALDTPAAHYTEPSLQALRDQIVALFQQDKWLGVALQMVDEKALSIDMLNTLIQWQALYIQFGEKFFSLNIDPTMGNSQATVHHIVFAQAQLTLHQIRASDWGRKIEAYMTDLRRQQNTQWDPTLDNFSTALISTYIGLSEDRSQFRAKSPSTLMIEHELKTLKEPSHILPLYSFGFLAFEDFCAAAFLGGRPMQAYLPRAKGNLYWAHGSYYGEALMVHHDYVHATTYDDADEMNLDKRMRMIAIIANAMVRINEVELANRLIDTGDIVSLDFSLLAVYNSSIDRNEFINNRIKILKAIYNEFALAAGLSFSFSCEQNTENNDIFQLKAMHQEQALSFTVDLSNKSNNDNEHGYLEDFMKAFEEISSLSTIQIEQPQQQRPRWSPTIMLWTMRATVFCTLVGIACLSLGLSGVLNNPILAGVLLPVIGIASALVSKWVINPELVGQGDHMCEFNIAAHAVQHPSLINNNNANNEQPKPGCFISYLPYDPNKKPQPQASSPPSFKITQ